MTVCDLGSSSRTRPRAVLNDPGPESRLPKAFLNCSLLIHETAVMTRAPSPQPVQQHPVQHPAAQGQVSAAAAVGHQALPAGRPGPGAPTDPRPTQP